MSDTPSLVRQDAEEILSDAFSGRVELGKADSLDNRQNVSRFGVLSGPEGCPSSVVVKRPALEEGKIYDPKSRVWTNRGFFNDWAGLQFSSEIFDAPIPVPQLYGGSRNKGLIVIGDLGNEESLDEILLGTNGLKAKEALIELAKTIGRLHAGSLGKEAIYDKIRRALGPVDGPVRISEELDDLLERFNEVCEVFGVRPRRGFKGELKGAVTPGVLCTYTHGDPCPDNIRYDDSRVKLIDFEKACYQNALREGVYGRMYFPSCWCVRKIPSLVFRQMESAYRIELAKGCREAEDDTVFYRSVTAACTYWAISAFYMTTRPSNALKGTLTDLARRLGVDIEDEWRGITAIRGRIFSRIEKLAQTSEEFGYFKAIGGTARDLVGKLEKLWPSECARKCLYIQLSDHLIDAL